MWLAQLNALKSCVNLFNCLRQLSLALSLLLLSAMPVIAAESSDKAASASSDFASLLGQMFLVLFFVIGLLLFMAWMLKRMGLATGALNGQLAVVGSVSVGQREKVVLIQVGQEQLLIGVTAHDISLLHLVSEPIVVNQAETAQPFNQLTESFSSQLTKAFAKRQVKDAS